MVTRWVPVGGVDESVEGIGNLAVGFFSLPVEGVEKSRWEIFSQTVGNVGKSRLVFFPYPLKALRKAVGKSCWEKPLGKFVLLSGLMSFKPTKHGHQLEIIIESDTKTISAEVDEQLL